MGPAEEGRGDVEGLGSESGPSAWCTSIQWNERITVQPINRKEMDRHVHYFLYNSHLPHMHTQASFSEYASPYSLKKLRPLSQFPQYVA